MEMTMCIVGGGYSATNIIRGFLQHRIHRGGADEPARIVVLEPRTVLGLGPAWQESDLRMSANMTTSSLMRYGKLDPDTLDFDVFNKSELFDDAGRDPANAKTYVKRNTVGSKLSQEWDETTAVAEMHGVAIEHVRAKATAVHRQGDGFRVEADNGRIIEAHCLALALGLLSRDRYPHLAGVGRYFPESWDWQAVDGRILPCDRVTILGLGPTAIDWMLRLSGLGLDHPIYAASPSGELPAVRPVVEPEQFNHMINQDWIHQKGRQEAFDPRAVCFLVRGILAQARVPADQIESIAHVSPDTHWDRFQRSLRNSNTRQPLFDALKMFDELLPAIWQHCTEAGRRTIRDQIASQHRKLSFAIPPATAQALTQLVQLQHVKIFAGLQPDIAHDGHQFIIPLGDGTQLQSDVLINATGSEGDITEVNNPLIHQLLGEGLLVADDAFGGVYMHPQTGNALTKDRKPIPGVFVAGGSLSRGSRFVTNTLVGTSELGLAVGANIGRMLVDRRSRSITLAAEPS